jgi:hypothetical protein
MLSTVLLAVAHARLFTAPAPDAAPQQTFMQAPNVAYQQTFMPVESAVSPLMQPQVIMEVPVPQRSESYGSGVALGVALLTAGFGVVAGRQAMLFYSGGSGKAKEGIVREGSRAANRGGPYSANKKNVQTQRNGFGSFMQKFQTVSGKSKYGVPIFLPNGNVNPAYLAAERKDIQAQSKRNSQATEAKRKNLIKNKSFELADYIRKAVGPVGSGKDYYQSGR